MGRRPHLRPVAIDRLVQNSTYDIACRTACHLVRPRAESEDFPASDAESPHVRLVRELLIVDALDGEPLDRELEEGTKRFGVIFLQRHAHLHGAIQRYRTSSCILCAERDGDAGLRSYKWKNSRPETVKVAQLVLLSKAVNFYPSSFKQVSVPSILSLVLPKKRKLFKFMLK